MLCQALELGVFWEETFSQDIFFDTNEEIVYYFHIKNPQFYYASIDPGLFARKRHGYNEHGKSIEIKGCMKQHLLVYKPNSTEVMCREYPCGCFECLQLNFDNCCSSNQLDDMENTQRTTLTIKLKLKIMVNISSNL